MSGRRWAGRTETCEAKGKTREHAMRELCVRRRVLLTETAAVREASGVRVTGLAA